MKKYKKPFFLIIGILLFCSLYMLNATQKPYWIYDSNLKGKIELKNKPSQSLVKIEKNNLVYCIVTSFESQDFTEVTEMRYLYIKILMMGNSHPFPILSLNENIVKKYDITLVDILDNAAIGDKNVLINFNPFNVTTLKTSIKLTMSEKSDILKNILLNANAVYYESNMAIYQFNYKE